jgi:putative membrane protein insertion efficiency factor
MTAPAPAPTTERRGPVARFLLAAIRAYRYTAPARAPRCRYLPTCSEYAAEAVERFGPAKGSWLALKRLGRCHPLGSHGLDPVPEK